MSIGRSARLFVLFAAVLLLGANRAAAQRGAGRGQGPVHYDIAKEVTVTGTIEDVRSVTGSGPGAGTHLTLKTSSETLNLALGPTRYMTQKKFALAKGDQIEVIKNVRGV